MNFSLHYGHTVAYCTHKPFTRRILEFAVRCYIDFSDISEQSEFVIGMAGTIEHRPCDSWPFNTIPFFNIEANYVDFELIYYLLYLVVFILRSKFHFFFFFIHFSSICSSVFGYFAIFICLINKMLKFSNDLIIHLYILLPFLPFLQ